MAAMKREKQYDMFDVATGACTLDDYLFQRYSENDLSSSFWIDKKDEVDELRPPKPLADGQPGSEPEIIPIQGPRAEAAKRAAGLTPEGPPPVPIGLEPDRPAPTEPAPLQSEFPPAADGSERLASSVAPTPVPSLESFKSGQSAPPGEETYTAHPVEKPAAIDGSDAVQFSVETARQDEGPKAPSMEDLLARFHQAAKEYNERSQPSDLEPETSDVDSEPPSDVS